MKVSPEYVILFKMSSPKSAGKVAYVTTLLPYPCLATLLINGLAQDGDGAMEGIKFYITPSLSRLGDSSVWLDAAVQIFFSVSLSMGGITTLASYNDIHTNIFTTALLVPVVNCLTSVFAGFAVFSYIGILAENANLGVDEVVDSGELLLFRFLDWDWVLLLVQCTLYFFSLFLVLL